MMLFFCANGCHVGNLSACLTPSEEEDETPKRESRLASLYYVWMSRPWIFCLCGLFLKFFLVGRSDAIESTCDSFRLEGFKVRNDWDQEWLASETRSWSKNPNVAWLDLAVELLGVVICFRGFNIFLIAAIAELPKYQFPTERSSFHFVCFTRPKTGMKWAQIYTLTAYYKVSQLNYQSCLWLNLWHRRSLRRWSARRGSGFTTPAQAVCERSSLLGSRMGAWPVTGSEHRAFGSQNPTALRQQHHSSCVDLRFWCRSHVAERMLVAREHVAAWSRRRSVIRDGPRANGLAWHSCSAY